MGEAENGKKKGGVSLKLLIGMIISGVIGLGLVAAAWITDWPQYPSGWQIVTYGVGLGITILAWGVMIALAFVLLLGTEVTGF
jgi:hypothetical protein